MKQFDPSLYFITDSTGVSEEEFLYRVERALMGGVTILQLREKNKTTREYITLAEKVHELTKKYAVPLIIDDRVDVALAVDAEGVHLGAEDMTIAQARKILGDGKIIGATAKTVPWAFFHQRRPVPCPPPGAVIMMAEEKENANIRWKGIT